MTYGIDRRTLRRHRDKKVKNPVEALLGRFHSTFNKAHEDAVVEKKNHGSNVAWTHSG